MLRWIRRWTVLVAAVALLFIGTAQARAISTSESGTHEGWFYSLSRQLGTVDLQLHDGGSYSVTWSQGATFLAGTGWQPGGPRTLTYSAAFEPRGNAYLAVYGWTRAPLTEYSIVESWGSYRPTGTRWAPSPPTAASTTSTGSGGSRRPRSTPRHGFCT